jgi:hypothetical protein
LSYWIKTYGIPQALYCDHKNAFVLTREPADAELLAGITNPKSHFGKSCAKLGVEVIAANSPQAKGRVETGWTKTGWSRNCTWPVFRPLNMPTGSFWKPIFRR